MQEKTNHVAEKTQSLESNEQMRGMMPPPFSFADGDGGNVSLKINYLDDLTIEEGAPVGNLGLTTPLVVVEGMQIEKMGERYQAAADFICWPKIEIWPAAPGNPPGFINIDNEDSPLITASNYVQVATALMPLPDGRQRGGVYWSRPQVMKHETFHANDIIEKGRDSVPKIQKRVAGLQVSSEADLEFEIFGAAQDLVAELEFMMDGEAAEDRAYKACYESNAALARAIYAKGKAGEYH